jgi:hypothetical protein
VERPTKMATSRNDQTVGDGRAAMNVANAKALQSEALQGSELSASELESVVGGVGGAGAGKVTFNPFQITRRLN